MQTVSAFDGDGAVTECVKLLCELFFHPHVENGAFDAQDVEREKRLLLERIENERNDKRTYALRRCEALMCEHEAYGINRYGTPENVKSLTPQRLYEAWKALLSSGRLQFNLVGEADVACGPITVEGRAFQNRTRGNSRGCMGDTDHPARGAATAGGRAAPCAAG